MKLLMIGDVVSHPGCETVRSCLPALKRRFGADAAIVNGENSAVGNGILPSSAEHLLDSGADVITTGNHAFKRREIYDYFSSHEQVIRPANYPPPAPGTGVYRYDGGAFSLLVINLQGTSFMEPIENPFWRLIGFCVKKKRQRLPWSIFTRRLPEKKRPWAFIWTEGLAQCSAHIRMCRRPMRKSFQTEPRI